MLTVRDGLPAELAQGLLARPGEHPVIMRFSTNPGDILDDSISVPRGLAIKVLDVDGERLAGSEDDTTQDFILVNGPVFAAPDPKAFLGNLQKLAKTTDKAEGLKKALSAVLQTTEAALETVGIKSATIQQLGGAPNVHPLGEIYYSQTAYLYGSYVAKFALFPISAGLKEVEKAKVNASGRPDALREEIAEVIVEQGGTWELRVQLCTDPEAMPIEDPTVQWDETASPFVAVATITVPPQASWIAGDSEILDEKLSFSIWHGLAAHRPLGGVNRARREPYQMSATFRGRVNGCPMHEPRVLEDVIS